MSHTMFLIVSFYLLQLISANDNQDISSVLNHVTSMERMLSNLQSQLTTTQTKLQATESEVAYMKSSQQSTENELESVRTELKMTQTELKTTVFELANLKSSQQSTESELESVRTELKSVRSKLDSTEASVKSEILERGRRFAFEVLLSKDYSKNFITNEVLKFDHIPLNIGNAYNPRSGILVVPENGTYLIWANVLYNGNGLFTIALMKDNNVLTRGYTGDDLKFGMAVINHLVQLEKGDHVWFIVENNASVRGDSYSSFGGILMYT